MKKITSDKWVLVAFAFFVLASGYMPPAGATPEIKKFPIAEVLCTQQQIWFDGPGNGIPGAFVVGGQQNGGILLRCGKGAEGIPPAARTGEILWELYQTVPINAQYMALNEIGIFAVATTANPLTLLAGKGWKPYSRTSGWNSFLLYQQDADQFFLTALFGRGIVIGRVDRDVAHPCATCQGIFISPQNRLQWVKRPLVTIYAPAPTAVAKNSARNRPATAPDTWGVTTESLDPMYGWVQKGKDLILMDKNQILTSGTVEVNVVGPPQ